jgi:hypothetical protein
MRDRQYGPMWLLHSQLVLDRLPERKSDELGIFLAKKNWERRSIPIENYQKL